MVAHAQGIWRAADILVFRYHRCSVHEGPGCKMRYCVLRFWGVQEHFDKSGNKPRFNKGPNSII